MVILTNEQAQQIEEALMMLPDNRMDLGLFQKALESIRAARAHKQEPVAIADGTFNHNCPLGTPLYAAPQPMKQEPMMDYERINALREGEQNEAEDAYFFARPENDTPTLRKMFCQGFERGFHKGLKYAAPVRTKDLTDDEIWEAVTKSDGTLLSAHRAVIAADRRLNK